jgi:hypothetical protein
MAWSVPALAQRGARAAREGGGEPSVKDIMIKIGKGPNALTPAIGQALQSPSPAWDTLQGQATDYAQQAAALGRNAPPRGSKESWTELTTAFIDAANDLEKAVRAKNRDDARVAHDQLAGSCMSCHRAHRGGPGGGGGGPPGGGPPGGFGSGFGGPPGGRFPGGSPDAVGNRPQGRGPGGSGALPGGGSPDSPEGVARAFLAALKQKDPAALAGTISPRAPAEVTIRTHKKTFEAILQSRLPDEDIDKLADEFAGYDVTGTPSRGMGGKLVVTLTKGSVKRKIYVRQDQDGWKIVDYGGPAGPLPRPKSTKGR